MKVIIMQGASGSGKSTYIKKNIPNSLICSADHYFIEDGVYRFNPSKLGEAHRNCLKNFINALIDGIADTLVVDNTNTTQVEMAPYVAVAGVYGATVEVIRCEAPVTICASRNTHGVPASACQSMFDRLQKPARFWNVTFTKVSTHEEI
jgi:predicted kinase